MHGLHLGEWRGRSMYDQILFDVADPVATITLHRPPQLNAWTDHMATEVKHAVARDRAANGGLRILPAIYAS